MIIEDLKKSDLLTKRSLVLSVTPNSLNEADSIELKKAAMANPKTEIGMLAFAMLGRNGQADSIQKLIGLIRDSSMNVRILATKSLALTGEFCIPPLLELSAQAGEDFMEGIVQILREIPKTSPDPFIIKLQSGTPTEKIAMARILGSFEQNEKAIVALIRTLTSADLQLIDAVINSLVEIGNRVLPILNKLIQSSHPKVINLLFKIMQKIGDPAKALIEEAIVSQNVNIRRAAARALNFSKDKSSLDILIKSLADSDELVAHNAANSLVDNGIAARDALRREYRLTTDNNQKHWFCYIFHRDYEYFEEEILNFFRSPETVDRIMILKTVPDDLNSTIFSRLIDLMNDFDFFVRELSIDRLTLTPNALLPTLTKALGDTRQGIFYGVIEVLRRKGRKATDHLIELVERGNDEQKYNAAHALGYLDDQRAVTPLRSLLGSGNDWVRQFAIRALGQLGDLESLCNLLSGGTEIDREAAVKGFSTMGARAFAPLLEVLRSSPKDKREKIAQGMAALGECIKPQLDEIVQTEQDENIRFFLLKISRGFNQKSEFI